MAKLVETSSSSAVVVDNGSELSRAGFAGEDSPRVIFPTIVGRPLATTNESKKIYVGTEASSQQGVHTIKHPIEHGIITDWEDMEQVGIPKLVYYLTCIL